MPNYGKEFRSLKSRMEKEKRKHKSKRGMSFGDCGCEKLAIEANQRANVAFGEGKFGKANAFGCMWTNMFNSKKNKEVPEVEDIEDRFAEDMARGGAFSDEGLSSEFGYNPALWEMQGPFYNHGYN